MCVRLVSEFVVKCIYMAHPIVLRQYNLFLQIDFLSVLSFIIVIETLPETPLIINRFTFLKLFACYNSAFQRS